MPNSMTGFAQAETRTSHATLRWELRSVNHRHLETHIRLPELFRSLETIVRQQLRQQLNRGKVEATLHYSVQQENANNLHINQALVAQIVRATDELAAHLVNPAPINLLDLLRWPGVITDTTIDVDELHREALAALISAVAELKEHRQREGNALAELIEQRLIALDAIIMQVREQLDVILQQHRERLSQRLAELLVKTDPQRIDQEIALLAQKSDVAEELDRLQTHLDEVRNTLNSSGPIGRRLDFLMQELNREANTLASKSICASTSMAAVELKVLIEQMREQIQNIE